MAGRPKTYYVTATTTYPKLVSLAAMNPPPVRVRACSAEAARAAYLRQVHGLDVLITSLGAPSWRYDSHREVGERLYTRLRVFEVVKLGRVPRLRQVYPPCC